MDPCMTQRSLNDDPFPFELELTKEEYDIVKLYRGLSDSMKSTFALFGWATITIHR